MTDIPRDGGAPVAAGVQPVADLLALAGRHYPPTLIYNEGWLPRGQYRRGGAIEPLPRWQRPL